jgi:3',5'-cyclic AMP phosphodiesterase CpdA
MIHRSWLFAPLAVALFQAALPTSTGAAQPLLRFVQLNDVHAGIDSPTYPLANDKLAYLVNAINAGAYFPLPDFVVGTGDMVNNRTTNDFTTATNALAGLNCPYFPGVGNHEDTQQEGNASYLALYRQFFGTGKENYSFTVKGVRFLMVDDSGAPTTNTTSVGIARDAWVASQLAASPGVPTIICAHIPLVSVRESSVLAASFGFTSYYAKDTTLLNTINQHADDVVAVLSGHLHLTGAVEINGIHHIVASGTGSYPCDFAYYEIYPDHMRVQMFTMPEELGLRSDSTDIHGLPRWTTDYTDPNHPTHERYVSGNPSERLFDIPFIFRAPGDANGDGHVNQTDAAILAAHWGANGGWPEGDFDGDGVVGAADASILAANWNHGSAEAASPEPGVAAILLSGAAGLVLRGRRPRGERRRIQ